MADLKEKILKLDEYLGKQRIDWTDKIKELTVNLKKGIELEEVSAYTLSYRQILVEQLASMSNKMRAQKGTVDQKYKQKWIEYYQYDYKLTDKQRERFLESDLADDKQLYDLLETQKSFIEASVKTLDNMGFAIKNRLDMSRI
jgi:predicted metal-dependent hydrolase|tara:strand:+ start:182 stop:610 length:429 start_codon:yes stop_codon:yes gene_type:complete